MWKNKQIEVEEPIKIDGIQSIEERENETFIKLGGVINSQVCNELMEKDLFSNKRLTIDLDDVTYLSSAGIKILSQFGLNATAKNVEYQVINVSEYLAKILNMTGYASSFKLVLKEAE